MTRDEEFMTIALEEAALAAAEGETPVGAVVVRYDEVIARAHNRREIEKNALCHAELSAIDQACKALGGWRLVDCDLYVTLEPCPMCSGAIINSRIVRLLYGARDSKAGCAGSVCNLFDMPFNHRPEITGGVLEAQCSAVLSDFFRDLRKSKAEPH